MERISRADAEAMHNDLRSWRSPVSLSERLDRHGKRYGFYAAGQGAMQPWREAYCAQRFAVALGASAVRLGEDPPDFYLQLGTVAVSCELVELRDPRSRPGLEFDALAALEARSDPIPPELFDPDDVLDWLPERLTACLGQKAAKHYPAGTVLAVYVHAFVFGGLEPQVRAIVEELVEPYVSEFRSIWVLGAGEFLLFEVRSD